MTEEMLSKAIDDLIEEQFGKSENAETKKEEMMEKSDLDQLPKNEDVNANGGKDIIKSEEGESKKEEKEEEKKEEIMEEAKKSQAASQEGEDLYKSLAAENATLRKSYQDLEKSFKESMENVGEIFKGLKYEIDTLKKSARPRKSIKGVEELEKSFNSEEPKELVNSKPETLKKSEVESAIEELAKSGQVSSSVATEYELYGSIMNPGVKSLISQKIIEMRKSK